MSLTINGHPVATDRAAGRRLLHAGTDRDAGTQVDPTSLEIPGVHGALITGVPATHQARTTRLHWEISGASRAQTEARLDALYGLLTAHALTVGRTRAGIDQVVPAELVSIAPADWALSGQSVRLAVILRLLDPFWRDAAPITAEVPAGTDVPIPGLGGGTAPITDAVVRVSAGTNSITDPQTGTGILWTRTGTYYARPSDLRAWTGGWVPTASDFSAELDYPPAGPLTLTPVYTASGTEYRVTTSRSIGIQARRAFL